ncbi:MAG: metal-dependent transcriptional regulator [Clostridia bacterium]|nr:metal-dependent transcriptional regulator [Clostridia bacterium]
MKIQESGEMYLETILQLSFDHEKVHSIDISEAMGFSKPSVSRAVSLLKEGGYITLDGNKAITLTDEGYEIATKIYERHVTLTALFEDIGVSKETATADACRMEHVISDETFAAIKKHIVKEHPGILAEIESKEPKSRIGSGK